MTRYVFKMPDLGEGTVEAELVAWHVKVGDLVEEDQIMAEVMTDKAAVEVPAPVKGRVLAINAAPGDMVPVGSELVVFDTDSGEEAAGEAARPEQAPAAAATGPATPATAAQRSSRARISRRRLRVSRRPWRQRVRAPQRRPDAPVPRRSR
jgi:2-oxoisovalerate dehydrogenase E2 component (dihydrolipoyl transacylase)